MFMYIWQRLESIGLATGPGGLCATKACNRIGGLATNPPCNKPIEDYSTLHRGPRQGFVREGPRQRYVAQGGGGDRDNPLFRVTAINMYIYIYIFIHISIYIYIYEILPLKSQPRAIRTPPAASSTHLSPYGPYDPRKGLQWTPQSWTLGLGPGLI